jgi:Lrp/AsnC family transcriptional regulator, leucine-responsive regulatory protein
MDQIKKIDEIDGNILNILQENARTPNVDIARRIGIAPSTVHERIRKLEQRGVIQGYETRLGDKGMGLGLTTFILVRTEEKVGATDIGETLAALPQVIETHFVAGQYAYLLKVRVADTDALKELLKRFGEIQGVIDTRTTLVLSTLKETLSVGFIPEKRSA